MPSSIALRFTFVERYNAPTLQADVELSDSCRVLALRQSQFAQSGYSSTGNRVRWSTVWQPALDVAAPGAGASDVFTR